MNDSRKVATMIMAMAENFNTTLTDARMGLIMESLKPFDDEAIGAAVKKILRTGRFFPTVAELLDAVEGGSQQDQIMLEAEHQWKQLWVAVEKGAWANYYGEKRPGPDAYLNPTALLVLRQMGGRGAMLEWKESDLHWRRKEWLELYQSLHGNERLLVEGPGAMRDLAGKAVKSIPGPK